MSDSTRPNVTVVQHPVVQEALTVARDKQTRFDRFRRLIKQITLLMAFELTRDYPVRPLAVETPMGPCTGSALARSVTLVPVLRAGLGMVDGVLDLLPAACVGYLGVYRDEQTLKPVIYYKKLPPNVAETDVIVIDPMLATAGSLSVAIDAVKAAGARNIKVLCLVASAPGLAALQRRHGDVAVFTAAVDEQLDERGFIVPGLGDAGDRLFGTA
jgi:uracil phosphoribosyltransferase